MKRQTILCFPYFYVFSPTTSSLICPMPDTKFGGSAVDSSDGIACLHGKKKIHCMSKYIFCHMVIRIEKTKW